MACVRRSSGRWAGPVVDTCCGGVEVWVRDRAVGQGGWTTCGAWPEPGPQTPGVPPLGAKSFQTRREKCTATGKRPCVPPRKPVGILAPAPCCCLWLHNAPALPRPLAARGPPSIGGVARSRDRQRLQGSRRCDRVVHSKVPPPGEGGDVLRCGWHCWVPEDRDVQAYVWPTGSGPPYLPNPPPWVAWHVSTESTSRATTEAAADKDAWRRVEHAVLEGGV